MIINNKDVIEDLKTYDDYFFHTLFSDVPYNLGTKWIIDKESGKVVPEGHIKDFMNKKWGVDWEEFFNQAYRVLKHGSYCVIFSIDRQTLPFEYYASKAGFEITQHLYMYSLSGFPKNLNVSKAIDRKLGKEREIIGIKEKVHDIRASNYLGEKRDTIEINVTKPNSDLAKTFDGYHAGVTPFKPCIEVMLVFRKPLKNKSFVEDILEIEEGNNNICPSVIDIKNNLVPYDDDPIPQIKQNKREVNAGNMYRGNSMENSKTKAIIGGSKDGRFPSQLFVDSNMAKKLDEQSGELKSGALLKHHKRNECKNIAMSGKNYERIDIDKDFLGNIGGSSKILYTCDYNKEEIEYIYYTKKASNHERNAGCENLKINSKSDKYEGGDTKCSVCNKYFLSGTNPCICDEKIHGSKAERAVNPISANFHPCLKPMKLIYQVSKLFKLPEKYEQNIYIPFSGVYSELIGFLSAGYKEENLYGCEIDPDFIQIGEARLKYWKDNDFYFKDSKKKKILKKKIKKQDFNLPKLF